MRNILQLTAAISLAAALGVTLPAVAQQGHEHDHHPGPGGHPGGPGGHPGGPGFHGGGPHPMHAIGERGYSFHGPGGGRREIRFFSPREHELWGGGRWHHEMRFGRMGYWYEVNGSWYFYDRPFDGPPAYVSEVEFMDPALAVGPVEVVAPVMVAPAPVVIVRPPPVVCIGPLCVR
jgi:hypothetical protein